MPFDAIPYQQPLNIAVVGTGISGLSAAWLLSRAHRVTVYEADSRVGGHSHTVTVPGPNGAEISVDTGFIVYNELNYPNLVALFEHLGVATQASDMSFSASLDDGRLEYGSRGIGGMFAQPLNIARPRFWRMASGVRRFYRDAGDLLKDPGAANLSLGDYLEREGYNRPFIDDHLLPLAAAVWSTAVTDMREHPAQAFIRFNHNHGLMRFRGRPQWRTVSGGSRAYVQRIISTLADRIHLATPVQRILRNPGGVVLEDAHGGHARYDHVVIATHADQARAMLGDASDQERRLLGAFRYTRNLAVLHQDERLMPRRRRAWSSWNYLSRQGDDAQRNACVTYWMNRLQSIDQRVPLFITLNPHREPAAGTVLRRITYTHPGYDNASIQAQPQLWELQGKHNTWFCGSYFGAGFHEDGLQAGLAVAEILGRVHRPWTVAGASDRLPGFAAWQDRAWTSVAAA